MMSPSPSHPDEPLSAFHDGELEEPERADIENRLQESPAARETLDEFQDLSRLLQSLPRRLAPPELMQGVRERIQTSLSARHSPEEKALPGRRSRVMWGASLTAAATLLIGVSLLLQTRPPERLAQGIRPSEAPTDGTFNTAIAATGARSEGDSSLVLDTPSESSGVPFRPALTANPESAPATRGTPLAAPSMEAASSPSALRIAGNRKDFADRAADRLVIDPRHPPSVADLVAYVDRVADQTVVVELEVIDVDRTAEDMLVLLRRRGVQIVGGDAASRQAVREFAEAEPSLIGVYIEGSDLQLAEVMDEIASEVSISDAATYRSELAQEPLGHRLQQLEEEYDRPGRRRQLPIRPAPRLADSSPDPGSVPVAPSMAASDSRPARSGVAPLEMARDESADATAEWGALVKVPESVYRDREVEGAFSASRATASAASRPPSPPRARPARTAARVALAGEDPVEIRRVLIVLQRIMEE